MYNLIKNNFIQFDKLLIDNYYKLSIDEVDTIILIRLNDLLQKNICVLNDEEIAASMKIPQNDLAKRIVELVKKGFITLELSSIDSREVFSLDETYKRLALILSGASDANKDNELKNKIRDTNNMLEKELNKILSPLEREMVQRWYVEDKYSDDEIYDAILNALKYKNRGVAYIDRSLQASRRDSKVVKQVEIQAGENIQDLFNRIYAKSK